MSKLYVRAALIALALTALPAFGQAPALAPPLAFEVATIKLARPLQEQAVSGKMHVGVNVDGARVDIGAMALTDLIGIAYKVKPHQITGPEWLPVDRFDIMAKIPDGVSKDKMPEMLQALLADRFKLTFHKEQKEHAIYALVVGKNGLKLKESPPDPEPAKEDGAPPKEEKGAMVIQNGNDRMQVKPTGNGATISGGPNGNTKMVMEDGHMHMEMSKMTLAGLAEALSRFVDQPVIDMTDLKGNYQMSLELSMEDLMNAARRQGMNIPAPPPGAGGSRPADSASDPSGSSIFQTVQQMGLKLEARRVPLDTIVVDHVEKSPTEN